MRLLDRRIGTLEQSCGFGIARLGLVALAGVPEQAADLAEDPRRGDAIAGRAKCLQDRLVMPMRNLAPAGRAAQVGDPFAELQAQRRLFDRRQAGKRLLVEAKGVVIGMDHASPIAGRPEVARASFPWPRSG